MAIFLHFEGLEGDVTAEGYKGWIECHSVDFGVGRSIQTATGSSSERESTAPTVSDITIVKSMDKCTPKLFEQACIGKSKLVKIDLVQTGDKLETYMSYELTNTLVSSYSVSSAGDRPTESLSFNCTKLIMKYIPFDNKHNPGSPIPAGYDISAAKKV
ncbi:MAG: type VI secretion system tube protein Hcp [Gammaproteobacteria bacterium]|nr:type VI secretion system tube protein Hcp [Gammaproteobacteria bacterium]MCB1923881.1 type VI secretion system tube protein Hcp [Gammaproteobacteria bacterium]